MDSSKEKLVFDVTRASLLNFSNSQTVTNNKKNVLDMLQIKNTSVLRKFCDVCKFFNIDPVHRLSLPLVVIFMCKSKHCVEIAETFIKLYDCDELMMNLHSNRNAVNKFGHYGLIFVGLFFVFIFVIWMISVISA